MKGDMGSAGIMIISALIFGYFGFTMSWNYTGTNGQFLLFVALLDWTLKVSAVVFALSAIVTMAAGAAGNLMYGVCSLIGAVLFVVIAIMDIADKQHATISPFLLIVFGLWNGYAALSSLRALKGDRPPE